MRLGHSGDLTRVGQDLRAAYGGEGQFPFRVPESSGFLNFFLIFKDLLFSQNRQQQGIIMLHRQSILLSTQQPDNGDSSSDVDSHTFRVSHSAFCESET